MFKHLEHHSELTQCNYITKEMNENYPRITEKLKNKYKKGEVVQFADYYELAHLFSEIRMHKASFVREYREEKILVTGTAENLEKLAELERREYKDNLKHYKRWVKMNKMIKDKSLSNVSRSTGGRIEPKNYIKPQLKSKRSLKDHKIKKYENVQCTTPDYSSYIFTNKDGMCMNSVKDRLPKDEYELLYDGQERNYKQQLTDKPILHSHKYNISCHKIWGLLDSIYFAGTVITTVGYGQIAPTTKNGHIFCLIYMPVGTTIFSVFLLICSKIISEKVSNILSVLALLFKNGRKDYKFKLYIVILIPMTIFIVFCVILPSLFFHKMESNFGGGRGARGWSFIDCMYYVVTTITTVGFGDYVPGKNGKLIFDTNVYHQQGEERKVNFDLWLRDFYEHVYTALTLFWLIPCVIFAEVIKCKIVEFVVRRIYLPLLDKKWNK